MSKQAAIYIIANKQNGTLYTGVTNDLSRRIYEHKTNIQKGFTQKYDCKILVYYEFYDDIRDAIGREKQIKGGSRKKKLALIEGLNPEWRDLHQDLA